VAGLKATAERQGDHYVLNGQKKWITWAVHADVSDKRKAREEKGKARQDKTRRQGKTRQGKEGKRRQDEILPHAIEAYDVVFSNLPFPCICFPLTLSLDPNH
jgi:alkylation response protein AidB-like acyl-CoA dehydrogenase